MKTKVSKPIKMYRALLYVCMALMTTNCQKYPLGLFDDKPDLCNAYFGEAAPDSIPLRFCADFFSDELHTPPVFSPDGLEVYWKPISSYGYAKIFEMRLEGDQWSKPFYASFNFNCINDAPFITADGERLYFLSSKESNYKHFDENIYYTTRSGNDWSDPKMVSEHINDFALHWGFSVAQNYNLYFQDADSHDLYYSRFVKGEYLEAEKLPETINSFTLMEGTPFIAPDESYLIFDRREGGHSDLYISFRDKDGKWQEAVRMGAAINTTGNEIYAQLSADMKYLFFLRMTNSGCFPYWVDTSVINTLKPDQ